MKDTYLAYRAQKAILETIQANIEETFADYTGEEEVWKVIQYDDQSEAQGMCYAIVSNTGRLILIDGGNMGNADQVNSIIAIWGMHVEAWIITHPHPDHIDAFRYVYPGASGVIDAIYDNGMDYEAYAAVANWWDHPESQGLYLEMTAGSEKVTSINAGDCLDFGTLKIMFYHAYDTYEESMGDVCNNASLVFKVEAGGKSMLFTGDCIRTAAYDKIMQTYGEDALKADYLQMPHHGYTRAFPDEYVLDYIQPEVCFFDAPTWLFGEDYNTQEHWDTLTAAGILCYRYETTPNAVALYE